MAGIMDTNAQTRNGAPTIIRAGLQIDGNIKTSSDILLEGEINGEVRANSITVAAGSRLKGSIFAAMVIVDGEVEGIVKCMKLQVNTTGSVSGEIYHSILVVEAGGKIDGKIVRQEKEQPTATRLISDETLRPADPELAEIVSTYTRIEA
ncbi:MAG: polymer-forming cytoskeletal protein [Paracoccaceae bacterium]|jgi:cytoskeletal protein CcmA (bactofilin family)|nr:polymer-forming cytoskeletal protein [Pseudomonadota bacterium]MDO7655795.1 polymer-forming cytoskeletal protein [Paracoccaceae bacterium]HAG26505.1 hypothetical protein [Rhodobacter sp.]MDO7708100.1 polymer-forming cytoskeletal protein [Paracoccaceae bacterium]MDP5322194.1 polymer-forming cytoskeletal protein [Paracoccaceae bacterium]